MTSSLKVWVSVDLTMFVLIIQLVKAIKQKNAYKKDVVVTSSSGLSVMVAYRVETSEDVARRVVL